MKRILFTSAFSDVRGGGQKSLLLLFSHIDRLAYVPLLWVPAEGEMGREAERLGVATLVSPMPRLRSLWAEGREDIAIFLKRHGVSAVHTDDPSLACWVALHKKRLNVKLVFHARVSDGFFADRVLERGCDAVIAVSHSAARRFSSAHIVYNAADLNVEPVFPATRADGTLHVGYFGRIHPRKGLECLIDAARVLPWVRLHIFGTGDRAYVQHLETRTSGAGIAWYGHLADPSEAMRLVDCVVLPAVEDEGLSRMLIEAMALGKAVIGSDISANAELFGDPAAGLLFRRRRVASLVDALGKMRESGAEVWGKLARKRAEEVLDAEANTRRIEEIYREAGI